MKVQCDCCGTCCRKGGPPLHTEDIGLIRSGVLALDDLLTVRRGELVLPPMASKPTPAETEWIKLQGKSGNWCCRFLNTSSNTCTIYANRPISCRKLKCWDTSEILAMAGKDLLSRADLIPGSDPLLPMVQLHDMQCPVPDLQGIIDLLDKGDEKEEIMTVLNTLVQKDLDIRTQAIQFFNLQVDLELFYFGRPLFQILGPLGFFAVETPKGIKMHFKPH